MRLIYWETDVFMEKSVKLSLNYQELPGPKVIKHFSCSTQLSMKLKVIMFYGPEQDRLRILLAVFEIRENKSQRNCPQRQNREKS